MAFPIFLLYEVRPECWFCQIAGKMGVLNANFWEKTPQVHLTIIRE